MAIKGLMRLLNAIWVLTCMVVELGRREIHNRLLGQQGLVKGFRREIKPIRIMLLETQG
jgi:hypothetical protein